MNAEEIKNKAAETMSNAKEKVEAIASDKRVQNAKASLLGYIADAKNWVVTNWNIPGWRGKAKVAAAFIVAFFFCRGVFCGWDTSSGVAGSNYCENDAEEFLPFGRDGGSQQDTISIWTCSNCGRQIQSKNAPSGTIRCPSGARKYCIFNKAN